MIYPKFSYYKHLAMVRLSGNISKYNSKNPLLKVVILLWFLIAISGITLSQVDDKSDLLADFSERVVSYKQILDQLTLEVAIHKQWVKSYQSQFLSEGGALEGSLDKELNEIWQEIERLEPLTKSSWLDNISKQLASNAFTNIPPNEIQNLIDSQNQYVGKIQADVLALEHSIEQTKQTYSLPEEALVTQISEVLYKHPEEYYVLETTLLHLLAGLETWGSWLEPSNNIGLLPEAEGRFMVSNTPILQTGVVPGGIGVVGFAQPITISRNGVPEGYTEDKYLYERVLVDYNDNIENVFQQVSYLDRLNYQYGLEIVGRTVRVYRKPIELELTLAAMLQKMGAPPEVAEVWVAEYAEIAHLPQSIQLSWLIAGNPLAKDYQLYIEDVLATFNLNALLAQNPTSGNFSSPTEWVDQDPFWEEVQKQPLLNIFFDLLDNASEEIKRSFIVSLFFLEPIPYGIEASSKNNEENNNNESFNLRSKPFFWSDTPNTNIDNLATPTIESISIVDPDQDLVAEALKQKNNLIKYWLPEQGYRIIPWSQRELLNPSEEGANYFIMAVTALSSFAPMKKQNHKTNYATIVSSIVELFGNK